MSIPEDLIMRHLNMLLSSSVPGSALHHLHIVSRVAGAVGPLGLSFEQQLETDISAIAPDSPASGERPEEFIARSIRAAGARLVDQGREVLFAGLSEEGWFVERMDALGRRLQREGRLAEHPDVVEATGVYAACRDGRRWRGRRWLTGPKAGQSDDLELLVGRPTRGEGRLFAEPFLLALVGLGGV